MPQPVENTEKATQNYKRKRNMQLQFSYAAFTWTPEKKDEEEARNLIDFVKVISFFPRQ